MQRHGTPSWDLKNLAKLATDCEFVRQSSFVNFPMLACLYSDCSCATFASPSTPGNGTVLQAVLQLCLTQIAHWMYRGGRMRRPAHSHTGIDWPLP
mmetsp:Transcript_51809/g.121444  ORF Transcript_51809/g.121444 Transcript_51809/m.121444 type:complete len:96 (-) Transcript_51809:45-332(-)